MIDHNRRTLMLGLGGIVTAAISGNAAALLATPSQTAGPFYPVKLPLDDDNDLTVVSGKTGTARGIITDVSGRILDINGQPLSGLRIEIWQCDANGRYRHPREMSSQQADENFQGHGFTTTNDRGQYRFRTIKPVPYPGRTPHIHVAVFPEGEQTFTTQLYVAGEKRNEADFLYNAIPRDKRDLVTAVFRPTTTPGAELEAGFDLILNRSDGTPRAS